MKENNIDYKELCKRHTPPTRVVKNTFFAAIFGGGAAFVGQLISSLFINFGAKRDDSYLYVTLIFIFIAALLTSLGVFDRIAKRAGAGSFLPVTGFSNSVTSAALDSKSEGFVLGLGSGIFTVAGPVLLYSVLSGVIYGLIYFIIKMV